MTATTMIVVIKIVEELKFLKKDLVKSWTVRWKVIGMMILGEENFVKL